VQPPSDDYSIVPLPGRIAVLASGGLDSSVMLGQIARTGRMVFPVYIRAGLRWEPDELRTLHRFARALGRDNVQPVTMLRLPMSDLAAGHWSITGRNVPGYNAAVASNYILGRNLSLLCKAAIFCAYNRVGEIAMAPLESNPFPDARPHGNVHCGKCTKCAERVAGFLEAGVPDPTLYARRPARPRPQH